MSIYKTFKQEVALQLSKILPVQMKCGLAEGYKLYGNLFFNRRPLKLADEEIFYRALDLSGCSVVEVGAHIGIYTLWFSNAVDKGQVIAIEPNPQNFNFLRKNITKNGFKNAVALNLGVGSEKGNLWFVSPRYNTAKGTFKQDKQELTAKSSVKTIRKFIQVKTFDQVVSECGVKVDFVKIDTEGFETQVIAGMTKTLENNKPLLYFEIHGLNDQQKADDLKKVINILDIYNYSTHKLSSKTPRVQTENIEKMGGGGFVSFTQQTKVKPDLSYWQ